MQNFRFSMATDVLFGKDQLKALPEVLGKYGKRVLLTYGGGSIKKTGLYDRVLALLQGFEVFELSGIDPNPRVESVAEGARICRENNVDVILAVGGGSTIDCSKGIAAATYYEGDAWEMVKKAGNPAGSAEAIKKAVPLCTVLTLSATGSETNTGSVISNPATNEKCPFASPLCLPKCSILEPENTYTVPKNQTAAGSVDIMSHLFEAYFVRESTCIPAGFCESLLRVVIQYAPVAMETPDDYEARANLMWAGSLAINGLCSAGQLPKAWSCHPLEHELSAFYDITHGVGLAILTPRWMRFVLAEDTADQFARFGVEVWGVDAGQDRFAIASQAIDKTEAFFKSLGVPMTLGEVGIDDTHFGDMAKHVAGLLTSAYVPLGEKDIIQILNDCL